MRRKRSWLQVLHLSTLCYLVVLGGGCGVKTQPRPPRQPNLPKVVDLRAEVLEGRVRLTWSITAESESLAGFKIYRSRPRPAPEECFNCVREYVLVETMRSSPGQSRFEFTDRDRTGKGRFTYRLAPFDRRERLGPDSNQASVLME